ncbi:hypothetical protein ILUMI_07162 [Ignelater luminosus]|uniref:Palmitoyl-protein thioesterase 1 n=1 Tax=Ignelater luminosus TaxID=2038154 RepID=A0A8K0D3Y9_IGNLU|nr:hypothetical protein ILUMI_07162 [Ignelater luminosus]
MRPWIGILQVTPVMMCMFMPKVGRCEWFDWDNKQIKNLSFIHVNFLGDSCCNPFSLGAIILRLKLALPRVHVHSLQIGNNIIEDTLNGFLMHPDKQIEIACNAIKSDPLLANGYNAIGYSQGAQFLRGLAQRCPEPQMKTLVSLGGQHQGVYGLPGCDALNSKFCDRIRPIISNLAYLSLAQNRLVQATYWHDPINKTAYIYGNTYLADINNEYIVNETYIKNLQSLENIVFIIFEKDDMVQPIESEWFGFYKEGQSRETESLQESHVYKRLGLDKMDEEKKLHFLSTPGNHLELNWSWFLENVINKFFK